MIIIIMKNTVELNRFLLFEEELNSFHFHGREMASLKNVFVESGNTSERLKNEPFFSCLVQIESNTRTIKSTIHKKTIFLFKWFTLFY